jgi:hypothetical protein
MVYGLYVLSPVNQPLPPLSARCVSIVANVAPAPGAPGPHDFAVHSTASPEHPAVQTRNHQIPSETASNIASPCDAAAALAFRFTFRDVGDTPLRPKRNGRECTPDLDSGKRNYFLRRGLTGFCGRRPAGKSIAGAATQTRCSVSTVRFLSTGGIANLSKWTQPVIHICVQRQKDRGIAKAVTSDWRAKSSSRPIKRRLDFDR